MTKFGGAIAQVLEFPKTKKPNNNINCRKKGINQNKEGSVRNINGAVWVDFYYLEERVRESSALQWNEKNAKLVRSQLIR